MGPYKRDPTGFKSEMARDEIKKKFTNMHAIANGSDYRWDILPEIAKENSGEKSPQVLVAGGDPDRRRVLKDISTQEDEFDVHNLPLSIDMDSIDFLTRPGIDSIDNNVNIIFKCKDSCKTILTQKHFQEINRFMDSVVQEPLWAKACVRETDGDHVDSFGCTSGAYLNITGQYEGILRNSKMTLS